MKPLYPLGTLWPHTLLRPDGLLECAVVFDVGAGVRPMTWYEPERHVCVEPYGPYADVLKAHGFEVHPICAGGFFGHGIDRSSYLEPVNGDSVAVYLLDVIEHMDKPEALEVIELAQAIADQIVVYTPLGFMEQTTDNWGYGGDEWQTHRSGWTPDEFPGWAIQRWTDPMYGEVFFAVWTR